ncbi:MAG: transcription termination factor NusA [Peptococcaceae bacterium]|jgi:N utilization substance protein A|nr:transcription termination factor NusA [Peptococcaceae bacterium]
MNMEFIEALHELEKERGIASEVLFEAIEAALISAYKKNFGSLQNVRVSIDRLTGEFKVFTRKTVAEKVEDPRAEVDLEEAKKIDPNYTLDDIVEYEVTPRDFGRIAAQTAKQVVVQRIREAERGMIYDEFINREGDIVTGIVQRYEQKNVIIDLGRVEAILPVQEQVPGETYQAFERIKTYVVEVKKTNKGPLIMLSHTHPGLIKRLFELEVPEIHDGLVEIKGISREAGARSKIAVLSKDPNVDPVGACVGPKGSRVQAIVTELKGEKIDIINFSTDPEEFVANSLSPAKVVCVYAKNVEKTALVVVPDYQLSLAIGKEGQNARLAAKLTGWKIDIKSESQAAAQNLLPQQNEYQEYDEYDEYGEYDDEYSEYDEAYDGEYDDEYGEYDGEYSEYDGEYDENAVNNEEGQDAGDTVAYSEVDSENGEYAAREEEAPSQENEGKDEARVNELSDTGAPETESASAADEEPLAEPGSAEKASRKDKKKKKG